MKSTFYKGIRPGTDHFSVKYYGLRDEMDKRFVHISFTV